MLKKLLVRFQVNGTQLTNYHSIQSRLQNTASHMSLNIGEQVVELRIGLGLFRLGLLIESHQKVIKNLDLDSDPKEFTTKAQKKNKHSPLGITIADGEPINVRLFASN